MSVLIDENGRPIILIREQSQKKRVKGQEAYRSNILAARGVSQILRSSLGPRGMDKLLVSPDGDVIVTNDGATIVQHMQIEHPTAKLMVELSRSQDNETGDGTTGVVVLAGSLLEQAQSLIDKGIHPLTVTEGFDKACDYATNYLETIHAKIDVMENKNEELIRGAMTALGSKVVSKYQRKLAEIAVSAVLSVADIERKDVNFELIKVNNNSYNRSKEKLEEV